MFWSEAVFFLMLMVWIAGWGIRTWRVNGKPSPDLQTTSQREAEIGTVRVRDCWVLPRTTNAMQQCFVSFHCQFAGMVRNLALLVSSAKVMSAECGQGAMYLQECPNTCKYHVIPGLRFVVILHMRPGSFGQEHRLLVAFNWFCWPSQSPKPSTHPYVQRKPFP